MKTRAVISLAAWTGVAAASVGAGVALVAAGRNSSFELAVTALVLAVLTLGAVVVSARRYGDGLSLLSLSAVFYFLAFCVGGVYAWMNPPVLPPISREAVLQAMQLATIAWAAFVAGYLLNLLRPLLRIFPALPAPPAGIAAPATIVPLVVGGWLARVVLIADDRYFHTVIVAGTGSTGTSWIAALGSILPTLAAACVGVEALKPGAAPRTRVAFWTLVAAEIAWAVPTGSRARLAEIVAMVIVLAYYARGRFPVRHTVAGATVLAFVVLPFGAAYRGDNVTYRSQTKTSLVQAAEHTFRRDPASFLSTGAEETFRRFADITSIAVIVGGPTQPLGEAPYSSLLWAGESLIPRLVLPDKTDTGRVGVDFASRYGFSAGGSTSTSIAITHVGELLLNFGVLGVLFGMPFIGAAYRFVNDYLGTRLRSPVVLVVYATSAWSIVVGHETIVALGLVGVFKTTLALWLVLALVASMQRRRLKSVPALPTYRGAAA